MKLDSEGQRQTLIELIGSVKVTVSLRDIDAQRDEFHKIMKALMDAGLEPPPKLVVPIEFLAPDTPGHIRRFAGMPGFEEANGGG